MKTLEETIASILDIYGQENSPKYSYWMYREEMHKDIADTIRAAFCVLPRHDWEAATYYSEDKCSRCGAKREGE